MTTTPAETMVALDDATAKQMEALRQQVSAAAGREWSPAAFSEALIKLALSDYEHGLEWSDRTLAHAWLEKLRAQFTGLADVAADQVAPPGQREHGPAGARRRLDAAVGSGFLAFAYAERGLARWEALTPEAILRAHAAAWTAANPAIPAEVQDYEPVDGRSFCSFRFVVPALGGYTCGLFRLERRNAFYPLRITAVLGSDPESEDVEVLDQARLCEALLRIFMAPHTREVVRKIETRIALGATE
jgi:hypothetical protein